MIGKIEYIQVIVNQIRDLITAINDIYKGTLDY
jgi:hypothetical protein